MMALLVAAHGSAQDLLHIRVVADDSATYGAGAHAPKPLTVEVSEGGTTGHFGAADSAAFQTGTKAAASRSP